MDFISHFLAYLPVALVAAFVVQMIFSVVLYRARGAGLARKKFIAFVLVNACYDAVTPAILVSGILTMDKVSLKIAGYDMGWLSYVILLAIAFELSLLLQRVPFIQRAQQALRNPATALRTD